MASLNAYVAIVRRRSPSLAVGFPSTGAEVTTWLAMMERAARLRSAGRLEDALREVAKMESACAASSAKGVGVQSGAVVGLLSTKGIILGEMGLPEEALICDDSSLQVSIEVNGHDSTNTAIGHMNVGVDLALLGFYDGAIASHQLALDLFKRVGDDSSVNYAMGRLNMGEALAQSGEYEAGLVHMQAGLALRTKLLPPNDPAIDVALRLIYCTQQCKRSGAVGLEHIVAKPPTAGVAAVLTRIAEASAAPAGAAAAAAARADVSGEAAAQRSCVVAPRPSTSCQSSGSGGAAVAQRPAITACCGPGCGRALPKGGAVCGGCGRAAYCGKACQHADWKTGHKAACKR